MFVAPGYANPPGAAVAVGWYVGTAIGTVIYDAFDTQIQDMLDSVLKDSPKTEEETKTETERKEKRQQKEHDRYHEVCDKRAPSGLDPCQLAKWRYKQLSECLWLRIEWERRWAPFQSTRDKLNR